VCVFMFTDDDVYGSEYCSMLSGLIMTIDRGPILDFLSAAVFVAQT
jgi:hypothetical protein